MSVNIVLFHHFSAGSQQLQLPEGYWHMATCLRSIVISDYEEVPVSLQGYQVYKNEEAFEFLLQVICGLHSPLIGETEILGQFKAFVKNNDSHFSGNARQALNYVLKEAKGIRTEFLQNLGCTSYGSLLRKHVNESSLAMTIVGAGSLVEDILPWFAKKTLKLNVVTRNPRKHQNLLEQYSKLKLLDLAYGRQLAGGTLVIAAPLPSAWLQENFNLGSYSQIFDLRGESKEDPLCLPQVVSLESLFSDIESNKKQASVVKSNALEAIKNCAVKISHIEKLRPFGWEDLWTYA